jgi:hypothetical protein
LQVNDLYKSERQTRDLRKILLGFLIVFVLFTGVVLAVVIAGNEATKETHADGPILVSLQGEPIQVAPVESFASLWDFVVLPTTTLEKLSRVTFVYNMPSPKDPEVTHRVEGSFVVDGFYRPIDAETDAPLASQLVLLTKQGYALQRMMRRAKAPPRIWGMEAGVAWGHMGHTNRKEVA